MTETMTPEQVADWCREHARQYRVAGDILAERGDDKGQAVMEAGRQQAEQAAAAVELLSDEVIGLRAQLAAAHGAARNDGRVVASAGEGRAA